MINLYNINLFNSVVDFTKNFIYKRNESSSTQQKIASFELGFLSNGFGFTTPKAIEKIEKKAKTKIKQIDYSLPSNIPERQLNSEIENGLDYIQQHGLEKKYMSLAEAFLELVQSKKINAPLVLDIIKQVNQQAKSLDCIFLPGGDDVPPAWYLPQVPQSNTIYKGYYRSLIEFCLIREARNRGIPLMGVCRGLQIAYVYHGAKLEQNVPNQYGRQILTFSGKEMHGSLVELFRKGVNGEVIHNQGVKQEEGEKCPLATLSVYDGIIKAAESKFSGAAPMILTQFHPEMYRKPTEYDHQLKTYIKLPEKDIQLKNNSKIFNVFFQSILARNVKRKAITVEALAAAKNKLRSQVLTTGGKGGDLKPVFFHSWNDKD